MLLEEKLMWSDEENFSAELFLNISEEISEQVN